MPPDNPLSQFTKISPSIYIQDPESPTRPTQIILLTFWMNAPPRALSKYVLEYRRLRPTSRILILITSSSEFLLRFTRKAQHARLIPAVDAIRAIAPDPSTPNVHLHMFSNGGVFTATHLLSSYRAITGRKLPIENMIFDSAPGKATIPASVRAFSFILPRAWILHLLGKFLLYVFLGLGAVVRKVIRAKDAVSLAREAINDRRLVGSEVGKMRRWYIYSFVDELVDGRDVEAHADEAEGLGWVVKRERFGAPHVSHMRAEPERYWGIVREALG